ncbi:hypothetical protein BC830DRAFT_1110767 [Chytriomyces sp. MP71]|nr:hypothetical protein BC830DRAFT_1110767 [Chytriomyces sp. MP71]
MPALEAFGRRWPIASDDLLVPSLLGILVHVGLLAALGASLLIGCNAPLTGLYLRINTCLCALALVVEWRIASASLMGSVSDDAPRRARLASLVPVHVALGCADTVLQALGVAAVFVRDPTSSDSCAGAAMFLAQLGVTVGVACQVAWLLSLVNVIVLSAPLRFSSLETTDSWNACITFLCLGHSSAAHGHASRFRFRGILQNSRGGGSRGDDSLLRDVARVFGDVLHDAETVFSDIFIGLIYVRHLQHKQRKNPSYSGPHQLPSSSSSSTSSFNFPAFENSMRYDMEFATASPASITTNQPKGFTMTQTPSAPIPLTNISPKPFRDPSSPTLPDQHPHRIQFTPEIREIIHFSEYAEAIYGLPLHMLTNPRNFTRGLQMLCIPDCCLPRTSNNNNSVLDNVRSHLGRPGWPLCCIRERVPRDRHCDLVAISLENGLFRSPYLVCLDREFKKVVVAVRGTMSTADVLVDLNCDLAAVTVPRWGEDGVVMEPIRAQTHSGMLQTAMNIRQDVTGLLEGLVLDVQSEYKDYGVVICGHSLGAGVAALLTHLLLTSQATAHLPVHCYAYSPPGCIATPRANKYHFSRFCTSVVLGDDTVPRLNRYSVERLKRAVRRGVRACRARKVDVLGGFIGERMLGDRGVGLFVDLDDVFGIREGSDVERDAALDGSHVMDVREDETLAQSSFGGVDEAMLRVEPGGNFDLDGDELQIPGRVLHFRKEKVLSEESGMQHQAVAETETPEDDDDSSVAELNAVFNETSNQKPKRVYRAVWTIPDAFRDIVISSTMVSEHMPNVLGDVLRRCRARVDQDIDSGVFDGGVPDVDYRVKQ